MVTNDERRRIAAALRAYDGKDANADTIGETMAIIIGAGDFEGWSWREVFAHLADLIEPSCDRDELMELAEELDGLGLTGFSSGWSSGAVNVGSFARRIRKALGVES